MARPPIEVPRGPKTVRVVFVGSSTVVGPHHLQFSWPDFVGHWLNQWAKAKGLAVRFEVLNAGRESIVSTDIAAIVRTEVVPLRQGDAVAFAVHNRPVQGSKGTYRVNLRHGVSRLRTGTRHTVGIIFHDAK